MGRLLTPGPTGSLSALPSRMVPEGFSMPLEIALNRRGGESDEYAMLSPDQPPQPVKAAVSALATIAALGLALAAVVLTALFVTGRATGIW